jgi:hypothetical protein
MKPPKCRLCSGLHWNNEPHVFATNERLTGATNRTRATNSPNVGDVPVPQVVKADVDSGRLPVGDETPRVAVVRLGDVGRTANRRSRESYNAYQREYMRKRRASN